MTFFAGIDPSITNTGVVLLDDTGNIVSVYNSRAAKTEPGLDSIEKYACKTEGIINFIKDAIGENTIFACYEDYSFGSVHKGYSLAEFGGILKYRLYNTIKDITIKLIAPAKLKKYATGTGAASKDMMVDKALSESIFLQNAAKNVVTNDVCDAFFLAQMAWLANTQIPEPWHAIADRTMARTRMELIKTL